MGSSLAIGPPGSATTGERVDRAPWSLIESYAGAPCCSDQSLIEMQRRRLKEDRGHSCQRHTRHSLWLVWISSRCKRQLSATSALGQEQASWREPVGVSHHERLAVLQRIQRGDALGFSAPMWIAPHHVDEQYFKLLPGGLTEIGAEEATELARIFGKNGELRAERLS
jgi:hypothetical protein